MATKLKNIKFGDDLLKGSANSNSGVDYSFGTYDRIIEDNGSGTKTLMERSGSDGWRFYGTADTAGRLAYGSEGWTAGCSNELGWYDGVGSTTVIGYYSGDWYFNGTACYACAITVGSGSSWSPYYDSNIGCWSLNGYACGFTNGGTTWSPYYDSNIGCWSLNGYAFGIYDGTGATWSPYYDSNIGCWSLNGYAFGIADGTGATWSPYYDSNIGCWSLNGYACGIADGSGSSWSPSYDSNIGCWSLNGYAFGIADGTGSSWSPSYDSNIGCWSLNGYACGIADGTGATWSPYYDSSTGFWWPSSGTQFLATGIGDGTNGHLDMVASSGYFYLNGYYENGSYTVITGHLGGGVSAPRFQALDLGVKYIGVGTQGNESFYELSVDADGFVKATPVH